MTDKKTPTPRQQELDYSYKVRRLDVLASVAGTFIRWGFLFGIIVVITGTLGKFAGQYTFADIGIRFLGEFTISEALAYALAAGGATYGWKQRKLRQQSIERLAERPRQLEKFINPSRTSSKLTVTGTTRPEDKT